MLGRVVLGVPIWKGKAASFDDDDNEPEGIHDMNRAVEESCSGSSDGNREEVVTTELSAIMSLDELGTY
jgi:hypothetical protein